ncbi:carbohydrate kinase [bacterium]|nr:MAG: carbohydrate kinase [bacterium]
MNAQPFVIALDAGTSSVRALAFDTSGQQVGDIAQIAYSQTTTADGGVECEAPQLLDLLGQCLDELLSKVEGEVLAVGMSCFWHSLMAVNAEGAPQTPIYSWADNRARAYVGVLRELMDEDILHARLGTPFHTSFWPAKLLWLRDVRPELFESKLQWLSFGEFVALNWTKEPRVSLSMASGTGLFDQNKCDFDEEMLSHLPITRDQLLPLCDAGDATELKPELAQRWPRLTNAKWFMALGDGACSNIGGGGTDSSTLALNAGTSGALRVVLHDFEGAPPHGLWRYRVDKKRSLVGGALSNCGNVLMWARQTLLLPDDWQQQLEAMAPDSHGLSVLPFLAGERAPIWNPNAHFAVAGATLHTNSMDILRASLEAAALRYRVLGDLLAPLAPEAQITFSGGALEHVPAWQTIVCDAMGRSLCASKEAEASARGAALLALEAIGTISDVSDVPSERGEYLKPNANNSAIYARALERQTSLYSKLHETQ